MSFFKKLRSWRKNRDIPPPGCTLHDHSTAVAILDVSNPILAFTPSQRPPAPRPPESTVVSTLGRYAFDAAQTYLPPIQAVADIIPGVGSIIKGAIGGILSTLQLVDRYIQNKEDLETLTLRLHLLRHHIDNAPVARTSFEDTLRLRLLNALQKATSQLESIKNHIRGAPSLTQDIAGCITTINNHLFEYMVMSQMQLQHDVSEIKTSIVECARQVRLVENWVATGAPGRLPMTVSRGHATLVDATGREHNMLLDQCQYFDQLDAMLPVILFQCRPDEAEIQRWYIENKQYDFVMYDKNDSDVIQLTRESAIWSTMQPGTRIVMRVITEEIVDSTVTATYECPCGTPNTVHVSTGGAVAALQRGCTITCRQCERRYQIMLTRRNANVETNTLEKSQKGAGTIPKAEAKFLIRNFLAKRLMLYRLAQCCHCGWRGTHWHSPNCPFGDFRGALGPQS